MNIIWIINLCLLMQECLKTELVDQNGQSSEKKLSQVHRKFTFRQLDVIFISCVLWSDCEEAKTPITHSISLMDFSIGLF